MADTNVLILGDSTSMTRGIERRTYPFLMAEKSQWPEGTVFCNASLPGFTSADACSFFFHHGKTLDRLKAVILFLGNCDASSTELPKGRYTPLRQYRDALRNRLGMQPRRTAMKNRLTPFEWNGSFDMNLEAPEEPADFEYNLRRIVRACRERGVPVILVRPKAHRRFPPGIGKGNFYFYRYLGLPDRLAGTTKIPDARFLAASRLHEAGRWDEALQAYRVILETPGSFAGSSEYALLVTNNYAVCAAEAGRHAEAKTVFDLLLRERGIRQEIVWFNLAQLALLEGDTARHDDYLDRSYESDISLYRIRTPYLQAIDRIAADGVGHVHVVPMADLVADAEFVDHCHPLPVAQSRLADAVTALLSTIGVRGPATATIENRLTNPEMGLGNFAEFFTYFKTYAPHTPSDIQNGLKHLQNAPKEIRYAVKYYLKHPFFTSIADVAHYRPHTASDVGRFPEYFILRHTIPYLRQFEETPELREAFDATLGLLHSAADLSSILPPNAQPQVSTSAPEVNAAFEPGHLDAILSRLQMDLAAQLERGPQINERMKTTLYWYFRETLRFGAHSRVSMRYDRLFFENAAETLAMSLLIDRRLGGQRTARLRQMIRWVEDAVRIHDRYSQTVSLEAPAEIRQRDLLAYAADLNRLAQVVQGASAPRDSVAYVSQP